MKQDVPVLVILDLNNPRTDPLGTVAAMKQDETLASVRIVGFVSHVDVTTIDAARAAGVDEILARSAFAMKLPDLLASENLELVGLYTHFATADMPDHPLMEEQRTRARAGARREDPVDGLSQMGGRGKVVLAFELHQPERSTKMLGADVRKIRQVGP